MIDARQRILIATSALVLAALSHTVVAQDARRLLATEASGLVPVDDETRLLVTDLSGEIVLQVGKPGEMRFLSRARAGKKEDLPIALWLDRGTFVFRPIEGVPDQARVVQISVPQELAARVELATGGVVVASGLRGGLEIVGTNVAVEARGVDSGIDVDLEGGSVVIQSAGGDVRLRGRGFNATVEGSAGHVAIDLAGGQAKVRQVHGFDGDLDGVALVVDTVQGSFRLRARGGSAAVSGLEDGGEIDLDDTPLTIEKSKRDITITSDADVQFKDMEASLHFDVYGGSVRGSGNKGIVEVRTRNTTVVMEKIDSAVRVQGDGLDLKLSNVGGETLVYARSSQVTLDNIAGPLTVENDGGDVTIGRVTKEITLKSTGGAVTVRDVIGAIGVEADGQIVDVSWASLPADKDSTIKNQGGDVVVRFPGSSTGCRIQAVSKFGGVDSDIPGVRVFDDGRQADGAIGRASKPWVRVEAEGRVQLLGGGS